MYKGCDLLVAIEASEKSGNERCLAMYKSAFSEDGLSLVRLWALRFINITPDPAVCPHKFHGYKFLGIYGLLVDILLAMNHRIQPQIRYHDGLKFIALQYSSIQSQLFFSISYYKIRACTSANYKFITYTLHNHNWIFLQNQSEACFVYQGMNRI